MMECTIEKARKLYPDVPEAILGSLYRYVEQRIPTGDFLRAILSNDLSESFARADHNNRQRMFPIINFIYNTVPSPAWGSPDKVKEWLNNDR